MSLPPREVKRAAKLDPFSEGRKVSRFGVYLVIGFFGVFGAWATFAPLAGAIIVPGIIKAASYRKTVQHLEGGIVKEILVKAGDRVTAGQPLIILSEVQASSAVEGLRLQFDGEMARAARLRSEKTLQGEVAFPELLTARRNDSRVAALLVAEKAAFEARRQLVDRQVALLRAQNKEAQEELRSIENQIKSTDEQIKFNKEELKMGEDLHAEQFVAYARVLQLKRQLSEKEEKRSEHLAMVSANKQKISDRELRIVSLFDGYVKDATEELKDVERRMSDLEERLRPSEDQLQRRTIVAPIAGEVVDLRVTTIGGVIAPGVPLMDIAPVDAAVIIEGKVRIEDIDEVRVGSDVDVMLSAYKRRTTPKVAGKVIYASGDTLQEAGPTGNLPYYLVHIEVDKKSLAEMGNLSLTPGMPAESFIRTRERTMLRYMLEPITDTLRKAMRES